MLGCMITQENQTILSNCVEYEEGLEALKQRLGRKNCKAFSIQGLRKFFRPEVAQDFREAIPAMKMVEKVTQSPNALARVDFLVEYNKNRCDREALIKVFTPDKCCSAS